MHPDRCVGISCPLGIFSGLFFLLIPLLCLAVCPAVAEAASVANTLQKQVSQEQTRAKERRESLSRLTAEERNVDKDLAAAEKRILFLEESLSKEAKNIEALAASDAELQAKGEMLRTEQGKTEMAMGEVMRLLWEFEARREGVKGRDLPDWHVTDRERAWSLELFSSLEEYRKTLASQQQEMDAVAAKRDVLSKEVAERIVGLDKEKEDLLQGRVRYEQRLASLRKEKQDTEKELTSILTLVRNLNLQILAEEEQADIAKAKGKLPWPVIGKVSGRFNASAKPPIRGLTIALDGEVPVRAVHRGRVVHNDVLRGIGRVVILMHGEEYYSLYAFLSASSLRVGQDVTRGDTVGTSGFVTSLNGPGLYFELRYHQKAENPERWLSKL